MSETTEVSWASTRTKYSAIFGAPPTPMDDNDIGAVFRRHPFDIISELERVTASFNAGRVHSPWRALASKLDKIAGDHDHIDITAELRIRQAENWIRNAGCHVPDENEIRNELFHATGALLPGMETQLAPRMIALWQKERPRGEQSDQDFRDRAARNAATYHTRRHRPKPAIHQTV